MSQFKMTAPRFRKDPLPKLKKVTKPEPEPEPPKVAAAPAPEAVAPMDIPTIDAQGHVSTMNEDGEVADPDMDAVSIPDMETWLSNLERKVEPGDLTPAKVAQARHWLASYSGTFEFLVDLKAKGGIRTDRLACGVLNCWRADLRMQGAKQGKKPGAPAFKVATDPGVHRGTDGQVYKLQRSQNSGKLYAKVMGATPGQWSYVGSAPIRSGVVTAETVITLDDAAALGLQFGICVMCGRELTDPKSIAQGIGPVCIKRTRQP